MTIECPTCKKPLYTFDHGPQSRPHIRAFTCHKCGDTFKAQAITGPENVEKH